MKIEKYLNEKTTEHPMNHLNGIVGWAKDIQTSVKYENWKRVLDGLKALQKNIGASIKEIEKWLKENK